MAPPRDPVSCPWCPHETVNGDEFRTHLMVEHRKSQLASYVLERRGAASDDDRSVAGAGDEREQSDSDDDADERRDSERELVAR